MASRKPRWIRADDFVADSMEAWAKKIESFDPDEAKNLRRSAKSFRESGRPGLMPIWENTEEAKEFISAKSPKNRKRP